LAYARRIPLELSSRVRPAPPRPLFTSRFALLSAVLLTLGAPPASAHVRESPGYSTIRGEGARVVYTLSLEYELLARAVDLGPEAAAAADDSARREALQNARPALQTYLAERLTVSLDNARCAPELAGTSTEEQDGAAYARLDLLQLPR
jgi:hypothetical protein